MSANDLTHQTTFRVLAFQNEVSMAPGYYETVGPTHYVPEVVIWGEVDGCDWFEFAEVPGATPSTDRRKAKRKLNRYRKFRNWYARTTGRQAPLHVIGG